MSKRNAEEAELEADPNPAQAKKKAELDAVVESLDPDEEEEKKKQEEGEKKDSGGWSDYYLFPEDATDFVVVFTDLKLRVHMHSAILRYAFGRQELDKDGEPVKHESLFERALRLRHKELVVPAGAKTCLGYQGEAIDLCRELYETKDDTPLFETPPMVYALAADYFGLAKLAARCEKEIRSKPAVLVVHKDANPEDPLLIRFDWKTVEEFVVRFPWSSVVISTIDRNMYKLGPPDVKTKFLEKHRDLATHLAIYHYTK